MLRTIKWLLLALRMVPIARYARNDIIAIYAIWRAEIRANNGIIDKRYKKVDARLTMGRYMKYKNIVELNRIIDRTYGYVFGDI